MKTKAAAVKCCVKSCPRVRRWTVSLTLHRFTRHGPVELLVGLCDRHLRAHEAQLGRPLPEVDGAGEG